MADRAADARLVSEKDRAAITAEFVDICIRPFAVRVVEGQALSEGAGLTGKRLDVVDGVTVAQVAGTKVGPEFAGLVIEAEVTAFGIDRPAGLKKGNQLGALLRSDRAIVPSAPKPAHQTEDDVEF